MQPWLLIAVLVAATLPFVASILSSLLPATRVKDLGDYFVFGRKLEVDGFLKATIGYSLQVAAISLFFYWSFTYGLLPPLIVCAAWIGSYLLLAWAVKTGRLNSFLGVGVREDGAKTIHGYIGSRARATRLRSLAIVFVAVASILGLGGTMMAEIDYSAGYLTGLLGIPGTDEITRLSIQATILLFTLLYVLWGGYKSVVFTDRIQVPFAYLGFCIFAVGVAGIGISAGTGFATATLLALMTLSVVAILWIRTRLLQRVPASDWEKLTPYLTFGPILAILFVFSTYAFTEASGSLEALGPILLKPGAPLGFGIWGTIALLFANLVWQFADISGLQRLQSLEVATRQDGLRDAADALTFTGIESGIGWLMIILVAGIMQLAGLDAYEFLKTLGQRPDWTAVLAPLFVFTLSVYMLSTISGFISALSYISFYDLIPRNYAILTSKGGTSLSRLRAARLVTIVVVAAIFLLYLVIRAAAQDNIAAVLYGIYAFQIAILPAALVALLKPSWTVEPSAVIVSVGMGIVIAYAAATTTTPWPALAQLGVDVTSWGVMPPLLAGVASAAGYAVAFGIVRAIGRARFSFWPAKR